eukprot:Awhi_evm1s1064
MKHFAWWKKYCPDNLERLPRGEKNILPDDRLYFSTPFSRSVGDDYSFDYAWLLELKSQLLAATGASSEVDVEQILKIYLPEPNQEYGR